MSEKKNNNFLVQGSVLAIAGLLTRLIGMVYKIPLQRIIGDEGMGYYNTAHEIYNIALLISTYSIPVAVSKLVSENDSKGQYGNSNKIFRTAMGVSVVLGLIASAILYFKADSLATYQSYPSAATALRFLSPTVLVFSIMAIYRGFFQGKKTNVPTAISQVIEQIINALISILGAYLLLEAFRDTTAAMSYSAAGATLGSVTGAIFAMFFLILVFGINRPHFLKQEQMSTNDTIDSTKAIVITLLLTMLPLVLSQTIYQLSGIIDNKIFGNILEAKGIAESERGRLYGIYSTKFKWLYNVPVAISYAFSVTIIPTLSAHERAGEYSIINSKVASSIKLNMLIAIPSAVGLTVLARPIMLMFFKNASETLSVKLMQLGGSAVIFFAFSTFTNGVLQGVDRLKIPVINAAISLIIHIPLLYLLLKVFDFGAYGLVIGNVTYGLMVSILNWYSIRKELNYKQEIKTTFIIPLLCSLIMGLISWGVYTLFHLIIKSNTLSTIIAVIAALVVYPVTLVIFKGVSEEEILDFPKGRVLVRILKRMKLLS